MANLEGRPGRCPQNHLKYKDNLYVVAVAGLRRENCLACKRARDEVGSSFSEEFYKRADELYLEIMGYPANYFELLKQDFEKIRKERKKSTCKFDHEIVAPNLYTRPGGYGGCLACNRANAWCRNHQEDDLKEEADRYYEKIMTGLGHLRRADW